MPETDVKEFEVEENRNTDLKRANMIQFEEKGRTFRKTVINWKTMDIILILFWNCR